MAAITTDIDNVPVEIDESDLVFKANDRARMLRELAEIPAVSRLMEATAADVLTAEALARQVA